VRNFGSWTRVDERDVARALVPAAPRLIPVLATAGAAGQRIDTSVDAAGKIACATAGRDAPL